jgi:hypothetical protein
MTKKGNKEELINYLKAEKALLPALQQLVMSNTYRS